MVRKVNGACCQAQGYQFNPRGPTWWKESLDSCKPSRDLHTHTIDVLHTCLHTQ